PVARSCTKTSRRPARSFGTRLSARLSNATKRPSDDVDAWPKDPLSWSPSTPFESTLARVTASWAIAGARNVSQTSEAAAIERVRMQRMVVSDRLRSVAEDELEPRSERHALRRPRIGLDRLQIERQSAQPRIIREIAGERGAAARHEDEQRERRHD